MFNLIMQLPYQVKSIMLLIGLFTVGIGLLLIWRLGYKHLEYGFLYESKRTAMIANNKVEHFVYRAIAAVFFWAGLFLFIFFPKYRNQVKINHLDWKIAVRGNTRAQKSLNNSINILNSAYVSTYGPDAFLQMVQDFADANKLEVDFVFENSPADPTATTSSAPAAPAVPTAPAVTSAPAIEQTRTPTKMERIAADLIDAWQGSRTKPAMLVQVLQRILDQELPTFPGIVVSVESMSAVSEENDTDVPSWLRDAHNEANLGRKVEESQIPAPSNLIGTAMELPTEFVAAPATPAAVTNQHVGNRKKIDLNGPAKNKPAHFGSRKKVAVNKGKAKKQTAKTNRTTKKSKK